MPVPAFSNKQEVRFARENVNMNVTILVLLDSFAQGLIRVIGVSHFQNCPPSKIFGTQGGGINLHHRFNQIDDWVAPLTTNQYLAVSFIFAAAYARSSYSFKSQIHAYRTRRQSWPNTQRIASVARLIEGNHLSQGLFAAFTYQSCALAKKRLIHLYSGF